VTTGVDAAVERAAPESPKQVSLGSKLRRRARAILLRTASGRRAKPGIRVLVYHLMPPDHVFQGHVEAIREHGDLIDEAHLLRTLAAPDRNGSRRCQVLVTFDDGYQQCVSESSLVLTRLLDVSPLLFVVAAAVDPQLGAPRRLIKGADGTVHPLAAIDGLRAALRSGWSIGSHTTTHWDCGAGTDSDFQWQITGSKEVLERALDVEVRTFAYPYGRRRNTSDKAVAFLRRSGYDAGFTTRRGIIADGFDASPFLLPRDVVEPWWGPQEIAGCLAGGLDGLPAWR
jgi:peptidoglycan/xylan/chitin deacetylase (PgdA/CDA1 family)